MGGADDYEQHWPELFNTSEPQERMVYFDGGYIVSKEQEPEAELEPPRLIHKDTLKRYTYAPADPPRSEPKEYVCVPAKAEKKPARYVCTPVELEEEPVRHTYIPAKAKRESYPPITYRYVPAKKTSLPEPDPEPKKHIYAPVKAEKPAKPKSPTPWIGRTKAQVTEDNLAIARRLYGPKTMKDTDIIWVQDSKNGNLDTVSYGLVKGMKGYWKKYADEDYWFFIKE